MSSEGSSASGQTSAFETKPEVTRPGPQSFEDWLERFSRLLRLLASRTSFWTVVPSATLLAAIYFYVIADPLYVSESVISIQHKGAISSGIGAILGSVTGSGGTSNENAALEAYIVSNDLLVTLDKRFGLRNIYTNEPHNPLRRLAPGASQEELLSFYRSMIELDVRYDVGLLTMRVLDYSPTRARAINNAILEQAEAFVNRQSMAMMASSLRFARNELTAAQSAAARAPQVEQEVARLRLQAAQQAFASASSIAGQQQSFVTRIASPTFPSSATRPQRLLNTMAAALLAATVYAVFMLGLANIRDHHG